MPGEEDYSTSPVYLVKNANHCSQEQQLTQGDRGCTGFFAIHQNKPDCDFLLNDSILVSRRSKHFAIRHPIITGLILIVSFPHNKNDHHETDNKINTPDPVHRNYACIL